MTDLITTPATPAPDAASPVLVFELPNITGERSFDCATIPAATRLDLLKGAVRTYLANRCNSVTQRHNKDELVVAWLAYEAAQEADPLQSLVAKPEKDRPPAPDLEAALAEAIKALVDGNIRKMGDGTAKTRVAADPLVATVTGIVAREVHNSRKATDPKFTFLLARKEVGTDGIKYLNDKIDAKVAATPEAEQATMRTALEKLRDSKYINPAKVMLGITVGKAQAELPSIL